uniref:Uncharacterized protein n=1 Tax=Brassica oleracea var. oleracea TaxID=109376 RepID=A0A0D3AX73_BRAOL
MAGHQHPEANGSHQREDEFSSLVEIKEYADCSQGSIPQVVPKNKSNKNHNTVGGLGEEALFHVYRNEYNWPVLRVQKLLPITWNFHIITRRTRPRTEEIVRAQIKGLQRRQIVN